MGRPDLGAGLDSSPGEGGAAFENPSDEAIRKLLASAHRIAVVGLSAKPARPSHGVASYLRRHGYEIVPVNPTYPAVFGERSYPSLDDVPGHVDVVDVFRRSDAVGPVADAAIRIGARALWLQEGVIDVAAALRAQAAGLIVVIDRCMAVEHARLIARA